ncbi:hypothetical protein F5Y19DRAFT_478763 [Xylariaceae sp. FL1651]|nr:hypothetical protein F5Y19DRAFT_478763 [Xylariaceae sp. FL1651]
MTAPAPAPAPAPPTRTPATPHLLERPFFALDNESRAVRQRLRKTHPDYLSCFGDRRFTYPTTFGTLSGWIIIGDLAQKATSLQDTFSQLIDARVQEWPPPKPCYAVRCFLLGVNISHAAPHVVILCSHNDFSLFLRRIVIESNILLAHRSWRCFRLPYEPLVRTMPRFISTGARQHKNEQDLDSLDEYEVFIRRHHHDRLPIYINALVVEIWKDDTLVGTSTIGGVIEGNGQSFALTVAHIFYSHVLPEPRPFEIDESELGLFSSETESEVGDSIDELSDLDCEELDLGANLLSVVERPVSPSSSRHKLRVGRLKFISNLQGDDTRTHTGLDWALIELDDFVVDQLNTPGFRAYHPSIEGQVADLDQHVIIRTASAFLPSRILSDGIFGLPAGISAQSVTVVQTNGTQMGDSGSWAIKPGLDGVVGMLIGACPPLHEAYILPMERILDDIERQTGLKARIATFSKDEKEVQLRIPRRSDETVEYEPVVADQELKLFSKDFEVPEPSLKENIVEALLISDTRLGGQKFLPANKMTELLTHRSIKAELDASGVKPSDELVASVLDRACRLFLTLVWIENVEAIESLLDVGFVDSCLPVGISKSRAPNGRFRWAISPLRDKNSTISAFQDDAGSSQPRLEPWSEAFKKWRSVYTEAFADKQWLFLAPIFTPKTLEYRFEQECPLPFLTIGEQDTRSRPFSSIYRVKLHKAHKQISVKGDDKELFVAVKQLRSDIRDKFYDKAHAFQVTHKMNHQHIIKPIAFFRKGDSQYLVVPWADGGNLRDFWNSRDTSSAPLQRDPLLVHWALQQMSGLVDALDKLLERKYQHGDLRPENILCFNINQGYGTLMISVMSTGQNYEVSTDEHYFESTASIGTSLYGPPEVSHARWFLPDLWSMGCILLEFLIWLLYGENGLSEFNKVGNYRTYWEKVNGEVRVSEYVRHWLEDMSDDLEADTALQDVLEVVKTRLLVVTLSPHRNASLVNSRLSQIVNKATRNSAYLFNDVWWRRHRAPRAYPKTPFPSSYLRHLLQP